MWGLAAGWRPRLLVLTTAPPPPPPMFSFSEAAAQYNPEPLVSPTCFLILRPFPTSLLVPLKKPHPFPYEIYLT